jgi:hypothetical protein
MSPHCRGAPAGGELTGANSVADLAAVAAFELEADREVDERHEHHERDE